MKRIHRLALILSILFICISCDQVTKKIASQQLRSVPSISYLGNTFVLQFAKNKGAFLSIGSNWPLAFQLLFLKILPIIILSIFYILLFRTNKLNLLSVISISLLLGGGSSNMLDRIFNNGYVIDFMNMGVGSLRSGIFNFADVFIMAGSGLMLISILREKKLLNRKVDR